VPSLVEVCEGRADGLGWKLAPKGGAPLPGTRTLRECGIFAGAVLVLVEPEPLEDAEADQVRVPSPAAEVDRAGDAAYLRAPGGVAPRLSSLPGPDKPTSAIAPGAASWGRLIEHLRHLHNIVILDCGAGLQRAVSRASIDAADQVVLVTTPQLAKLDETGSIAESIQARGKAVVVVANQSPSRARSMRSTDGVRQVTVTHDPHHAKRLRTRGFTWPGAPVSWQVSVRE